MPLQMNKSSQLVLPGCEDVENQARVTALGSAIPLCSTRQRNTRRKARCTMDTRQHKGLEIAALFKIERKGEFYIVPSQTDNRTRYKVQAGQQLDNCTCQDFLNYQTKCKHIYAVEFVRQRENPTQQSQQIAEVPIRAKTAYTQNWPAYRLAQMYEKAKFQELLYDLCSGVDEPIQTVGRGRIPMKDIIFATAFKIYSTTSARRFMTDLRESFLKRHISQLPCYNSINGYMEKEELTPYLKWLITQSSLPLKSIESDFAVDSSGFSTSLHLRWFDEKYGKEQTEREWIKAHIMCGVTTNIVTSAEISGAHDADHNYFAPLVNETARRFNVREVSADKAYSSYANLRLVENKKATAYIDFKAGSTDKGRCEVWNRMFHYYSLNRESFMQHYHKRSNVETTFSMIKAKFGSRLRSKLPTAQANEALLKILCHNLCCLIQSIYELKIEATFWN
jgi:transposase